jgi:hypothetical protein
MRSPSRSIQITRVPGGKPYLVRNGSGIVTWPLGFTVVTVIVIPPTKVSYASPRAAASRPSSHTVR